MMDYEENLEKRGIPEIREGAPKYRPSRRNNNINDCLLLLLRLICGLLFPISSDRFGNYDDKRQV